MRKSSRLPDRPGTAALSSVCVVLLLFAAATPTAAQTPIAERSRAAETGFTIDDVLDVRNARLEDVSRDGRWAVVTMAALRDRIGVDNARFGDPTYIAPSVAEIDVIDTRTGEATKLFPEKRQARSFAWSPDGARLAFLLRDGDIYSLVLWDRASRRIEPVAMPPGRIAALDASPQWSGDGTKLLVPLQTTDWLKETRARFDHEIDGPIVVRSSRDPFLSWEEIRRRSLEESLALYDVNAKRFEPVLEQTLLASYGLTEDGRTLRYAQDITKKTDYDQIFGTEEKLEARPVEGGEATTLLPVTRRNDRVLWSGNGRSFTYVHDGGIFFSTVKGGTARRLTGLEKAEQDTTAPADSAARAAARERREKERFRPVRLSHDGSALIASNKQGLWLIETASGARELFHEAPAGEEEEEDDDASATSPRWEVAAWSRDGNAIYLSYASRTKWERGLYRYDRRTKQLSELIKDGRMYSGFNLSDDGSTLVFSIAEGNHPADVYAANADMTGMRRLTEANPGLERKLSRTALIDYLDADGHPLRGVLYYPLDYEQGKRYPTVFIVYETFFDDRYNATINYLTSHGYAVMEPSVNLEMGHPGEAWVKGVTAAANRLIEMGIADGERLGVHGTSYGGYAVNLLIAQTDRFAAAINISGKVDMISFYTDSPRLGVRNIHAPEKSQDRLGATLWEQPQKYVAHSAIMFADRIKTPLLILTGHADPNVPERTSMEMFYALRRLGREVEWVSYIDGGHGMPTVSVDEVIDYHERILDWYDSHLKGEKGKRVAEGG